MTRAVNVAYQEFTNILAKYLQIRFLCNRNASDLQMQRYIDFFTKRCVESWAKAHKQKAGKRVHSLEASVYWLKYKSRTNPKYASYYLPYICLISISFFFFLRFFFFLFSSLFSLDLFLNVLNFLVFSFISILENCSSF